MQHPIKRYLCLWSPLLVFPQSLFQRGLCGAALSQHHPIPAHSPHMWLWGEDQWHKPSPTPETLKGRKTCSNSRQSLASLVLLAPPARKVVMVTMGKICISSGNEDCCGRYLQLWKRQGDLWGPVCSSSWRGQVGAPKHLS